MKKKIVSLCLVVALIAIAAVGTLAYFTDTDKATNTFTVGNVKIDLTETEWDKENSHIANPGVPVAKNPVVENTGANDAYIRLDVTVSDWAELKAAAAAHEITDLSGIFGGYSANWVRYAETKDADDDTMTYSYIYNGVVKAGSETDAIFTSVTVPAEFTSTEMEALGDDVTITINAFAIQAQGEETALITELKAMTAE